MTKVLQFLQDFDLLVLPNYSTLREKLIAPTEAQPVLHFCKQLVEAAEACEVSSEIFQTLLNPVNDLVINCMTSYHLMQGMSGRSLRKLPFLAHAALSNPNSCSASEFLCAMIDTAKREHSELPES